MSAEVEDYRKAPKCPECGSENTEWFFDGMDRKWFWCHKCNYQRWDH